jgi:hypothetical protein
MLTRVRAEGRVVSGWHHHGDREVHGHVLRGRVRFEFGPGGRETTDVEEGGYFHVPRGVVHRDVNPTDTPQDLTRGRRRSRRGTAGSSRWSWRRCRQEVLRDYRGAIRDYWNDNAFRAVVAGEARERGAL